MCEIDWTALGTWAAVVVALGISVSDKVAAHFRRNSEARILKVVIRQEIEALSNALLRVGCELNGCPPEKDAAALAFKLMADPDAPRRLRLLASQVDTPIIRSFLSRLPVFSAAFLSHLENVVFAAVDLSRYLEYSIQPGDDATRIDWLREKHVAANEAVLKLRKAEEWW